MSATSRAQAAVELRRISMGMRASQALYVAAEQKIADHLAIKAMNAKELAPLTGADALALQRILRALSAFGVFVEHQSGEFSLGPPGELLRTGFPGSFRAAVLQLVGEVRWRCWSDLLNSVRVGEGSARRVLVLELFDYYAAHPEVAAIHHDACEASRLRRPKPSCTL